MRAQYQRMKSNPFSTLRDKRMKMQNHSIQESDQIDTLITVERALPEEGKGKYRHKSFAKGKDSGVNINMGINCSFKDLGKELKEKKTLIEQNEQLRKKIDSLIQNKSSRKGSAMKKLSTQFEKEIYWNGSQSYMITGVKQQYQKMKDNYTKKSQAYEELIRSAAVSSNMEFLVYIEALQVENHILNRELQAVSNKAKAVNDQELVVYQLQDRISRYQHSLEEQKRKNRNRTAEIKKLKGKVTFLEQLLISKDNNEHNANKQAKKMEKERNQLLNKIRLLEEQIQRLKKDHSSTVQSIESHHQSKLQAQLQRQLSAQKQQAEVITRLQRENRYLQSLVQSWKADKLPKKQHHNNRDPHRQHRQQSQSFVHHSHNHLQSRDSSLAKSKQELHQHADNLLILSPKKNMQKEIEKSKHQQHQEQSVSLGDDSHIVPFTADHKNSEHSVKNRRVSIHDVQEIVEFSRLNLISHQLGVDWIVSRFQSRYDDNWSKQYISMGEARQILEKDMLLPKEKALTFARYLIQHSNQEYVFTDDLNEHPRAIVKSIIKALYGPYSVYSQQKEQFQQMLQTYRGKLQWLFESTTKGGVVSRDKFIDILNSLSINCKTGFDVYCVAKMSAHSENLEALRFSFLFEGLLKSD